MANSSEKVSFHFDMQCSSLRAEAFLVFDKGSQPTLGQQITDMRPTVGRQSADKRPQSADYRQKIFVEGGKRLSVDCRPTVGRLSVDCRPTITPISGIKPTSDITWKTGRIYKVIPKIKRFQQNLEKLPNYDRIQYSLVFQRPNTL